MVDVWTGWVGGERLPAGAGQRLLVRSPYDGGQVAEVGWTAPEQVEAAVAAAHAGRREVGAAAAHVRAAALAHVSARLDERSEEIARLVVAESGKPMVWARAEVARAVSTFRWGAEEARRFGGEVQRLDTDPASSGRVGLVRRFARGPVLGISPFNFPLNLVAHKLAPAVAVGAPIVLKPAPKTPLSALLLGELFAETGLHPAAVAVVVVPDERAPGLVADPRLPVISFTGSAGVGARIQQAVPHKHVTLELGGNAAALVCADWSSDADLDLAAARIATFGTYQAGQSCVSVQRVLVDASLADRFVPRLTAAVEALAVGDPSLDETTVGPLIDEASAERVAQWVDEAVAAGGRLLVGGERDGTTYPPTLLVDAPPDAKVTCEEVFGPVLVVSIVDGVDEGFAAVNDSRYGLQAGVFTRDLHVAFRAHRDLEVGGVVIGDVPSYRADQMPYGGAKESGVGREGVRAAIEDLSYERVLVLTDVAL
ncbi:MAG TPA: aldehyde dehydrogenase family protein [Actinomycetes bacterium]|jgi:acyl-CoA reductase-like NAD-dependent aldehyde dehydrogenase|nr:aldehyde dehydrogenase family protein [Actinomycetes bacterium]